MINRELISDLQGFRRTEAGYFAAFVLLHSEKIEGPQGSYDRGSGERSNSDFAGGGCASSAGDWAESSDPKNSTTEPITVDANSAVASKLSGGRW